MNNRWMKKYDKALIEQEITKHQAPYQDGIVEYLKPHDDHVEVVRVKLSQREWDSIKTSSAMQRIIFS